MADSAATRPSNLLSPEALDFAPDLLAIQERPPERLPRVILGSVVALVAVLLAWAALAKLDIIASAEGRLVPASFTKVVQPPEAGVVDEILVRDGDSVHEGQVLLRMDARLSKADTQATGTDVALRRLTLQRVDAELTGRVVLPARNDRADLFTQVEAQFKARRQAYQDALAQETAALSKARADLSASQQVLEKLTQTLPVYLKSADAYRKLVTEGFVGELAAAEKGREAVEKEQDLKTQTATVASLQAAIEQSEQRMASVRSQYRSQLEDLRVETLALLNRSSQEFEKSTVKAGMLEIRSPTDGIVKDLAVTARGAVVAAGASLLNVVPVGERLQAEVLLKNEDVGFIGTGQVARVKVAAYPFQKYGMLDGAVSMVSADSTDPKQAVQGQPAQMTYRALLRLQQPHLESAATGEKLPLTPGMLITAEIHQGRRTVLEYLLSPVRKVAQEAARER
jgi:HlyD family secretion protein